MKSAFLSAALGAVILCGPAGSAQSLATKRFIVAPLAEGRVANSAEVYVIVTDKHRFSMRAPLGWQVSFDPEARTVTLRRSESELTIQFDPPSRSADAEEWLKELRTRFFDSTVLERSSLTALSTAARGYDLRWTQGNGTPRFGRFARVITKEAQLEFALTSSTEEFGSCLAPMMRVMATMRMAGADEKFEVRSLPVE